jgi:hypothetical protein
VIRRDEGPGEFGEYAEGQVAQGGGGGGFSWSGAASAVGSAFEAVADNPIVGAVVDAAQYVAAPTLTLALAPVKAATHFVALTGWDAAEDLNSAVASVYRPLAADSVEQWKVGAAVGSAILGGAGVAELVPVVAGALGGGGAPAAPEALPPEALFTPVRLLPPEGAAPTAPSPSWMPLALVAGAVLLLLALFRRA